jgi:hypothetical protein
VGLPDRLTACGVRDTEAWEYESAIGDRTAGILYLAGADSRPDLGAVVRVSSSKARTSSSSAAARESVDHRRPDYFAAGGTSSLLRFCSSWILIFSTTIGSPRRP